MDRLNNILRAIGLALIIVNGAVSLRQKLRQPSGIIVPPLDDDPAADAFERAFQRAQRDATFQGDPEAGR